MRATLDRLTARLLDERSAAGHWTGELSSSALSTATASVALTLAGAGDEARVRAGLGWLVATQNEDGGWGDTIRSLSNISTTALCWAALTMASEPARGRPGTAVSATGDDTVGGLGEALERAREYVAGRAGGLEPNTLVEAVSRVYGSDRTFSVPILTVLATAGLLNEASRPDEEGRSGRSGGSGEESRSGGFGWVPQLPFELAAVPQSLYRWMRLPVVSYALPALIAIGLARHARHPTANPVLRVVRDAVRGRTLGTLEEIQPSNGGFLEATPLTSFVVASLVVAGLTDHVVTRRGLAFLRAAARPDGSWPIDTNLATWLTTLSVDALVTGAAATPIVSADERRLLESWLLGQQYRQPHRYTGAAPGGWAWTDLPGGVPDGDDTSGALLALGALGGLGPLGPLGPDARPSGELREAARAGVEWLLRLQNADGGIPTFCRGWGTLPFDRSSPDLTAHAIRAWQRWRPELGASAAARIDRALARALRYLVDTQRPDGAWRPLWFGNQHAADEANLVYGTARVLQGLASVPVDPVIGPAESRAVEWLLAAQADDGGWGGEAGLPSSVEETALAVSALAARRDAGPDARPDAGPDTRRDANAGPGVGDPFVGAVDAAIWRGATWLVDAERDGRIEEPTPIGFYFARLWYFERLYPIIFSVEALGAASRD